LLQVHISQFWSRNLVVWFGQNSSFVLKMGHQRISESYEVATVYINFNSGKSVNMLITK
jgi:hypothetical protein